VRRCLALSRASYRMVTASPGVRALAAQRLARGHALTGDRDSTERALDEAVRLSELAAANPDRVPPWIYYQTPTRLEIQRAMCYRDLGLYSIAIHMFTRAIADRPPTFRRDRGQYLARLAVALVQLGQHDQAGAILDEARQLAEITGSARTTAELDRVTL